MRVYRAVGLAEYEDLRQTGIFRVGEGMMEGKWFADTVAGVRLHAAQLYPVESHWIVAAEVPADLLERCYRPANLDRFGPATYLEAVDLPALVPLLFEFDVDDR